MFFIFGECLDAPMFVCPICSYTPICSYAPRGVHIPHMFPILLCICMFSEASACCGGCKGLSYMLDTSLTSPPVWVPPLQLHPHSVVGFPVHWYVSGILVCHMENFPFCWGFGGCSHQLGSGGHQHMGCPCAHSCIFL